jgi:hypothetical protein
MTDNIICSLHIFGPGRGESILLELSNENGKKDIYIIDTSSAKPTDSPQKNPIIAFQAENKFPWEHVIGICLSHPHEDHFTGLSAVARKTTNSVWMRQIASPLDSIVKHYNTIARVKGFKKSRQRSKQWIAESIRDIAEWGKSANDFYCIANRVFKWNNSNFTITFIAPEDNIATDYERKLQGNIDSQLINEPDSSPRNLHNIASTGIVIDYKSKIRILLLGDMVMESWKPLLKTGNHIQKLLLEKKANIIKLPHHCSSGAIFINLLEMMCDVNSTIAVFTPYSYKRSVPDIQTIEQVAGYVKELWGTVAPSTDIINTWKCLSSNGFFCDKLTESFLKNPVSITKNPVDCRVSVKLYNTGESYVDPGKYAWSFKK